MTVKELKREVTASGETIAVYQAGRLTVRLIGSFGEKQSLDELLYTIASQKLADKMRE